MPWWLPRSRLSLSTSFSVEDVKRRLAAATSDWSGDWEGRPVPGPPWDGESFVASPGTASFWFSIPVVVSGTVRESGDGAVLDAVLRPGGHQLVTLPIAAIVLGALALLRTDAFVALFVTTVFGLTAYVLLLANFWMKHADVAEVLARACDASNRAAESSQDTCG